MKKWFTSLNRNIKTVIISLLIVLIAVIIMIPMFFIGSIEIPLGLIIGILFNTLFIFLVDKTDKYDRKRNKPTFAVILSIIRLFLFIALAGLSAYFYYKKEIHYVNVIALVGGYLIPTIILLIINLKGDNKHVS